MKESISEASGHWASTISEGGKLTIQDRGMLQAIDNHMDIINLSFGDLKYAQSLYEGIKKASEHGLLIVAASGNEGNGNGTGNTINYPARHEEVISVTAINRHFKRSSFSGTGDTNDFAAPGKEIYSTY